MARRTPSTDWPPPPRPPERCGLCGREVPLLTEHHLLPRSQGRRRGYRMADLPTVMLCSACHKFLHRTFTNAELERGFTTVDALLQDERVQNFVAWVRRQPASKAVRVR